MKPDNEKSLMKTPQALPLYPTYPELTDFDCNDYPQLKSFFESGQTWRRQHWRWGADFLKYVGRNKSEHTYARFRTDVERFLLWVFLFKDKPMDGLRKSDILDYADFCWKPPVEWIGYASADRFLYKDGCFEVNPEWVPFKLKLMKKSNRDDPKPEKKHYQPSQETLKATFTAISAFYKYLINEELCYGNPAQVAKSDCRYFIADSQVKEVRRLTQEQWQYVLTTAESLANHDPTFERSLFVIASLKVLFLRISELSERKYWSPAMKHFWQDEHGNWWLKIFGKGRKLRDVSVPSQFLDYLARYRGYRGLPPLPSSSDNCPLVEKIRGRGGMTARHLTRIVQEIFDAAFERMKAEKGIETSQKLQEASTHWLRHTGASMEIERGRALKDLSEDLGHASMATTDTVYVQSEHKRRAESGKNRSI
jgi:site-specific recombinase XerD